MLAIAAELMKSDNEGRRREKKEGLQEIVELKVCIPTSYIRKIEENGNLNQSVLHICPVAK